VRYLASMPTSPEHDTRIRRFQSALSSAGLDAALLLHAVDVYYLAATRQNAALWIPADGAPVLLVRKSLVRAAEETAIADARPFPASKDLAAALGARGKVGVTFDAVPAATVEWWRKQLGGAELVDVSAALRAQRAVKSASEIAVMREGARRAARAFADIRSFLRPGMTELELAAEFEARLRRAGNEGAPRLRAFNAELFMGLAVAGASAATPGFFDGPVVGRGLHAAYPLGASERVIAAGEPIVVDYTIVHGGYVVDTTRSAVCGSLAPELERAFALAVRIQDEVARLLRPGVPCVEPWERARVMAEEGGLGDRFMGPPGDQARFVGHGVGLELDELPVLAAGAKGTIAAGNTIAVEPKFVFPGLGAIGIENTFVATDEGGERLIPLADDLIRA
jgi:Xaa-Pro aminopeptidase